MNYAQSPPIVEPFLPIELLVVDRAPTQAEAVALAVSIARDLRIRNTFSSFLKKLTVQPMHGQVILRLMAEVLDRDDGHKMTLYFARNIDALTATIHWNYVVHEIADFMHWTVQHEIDECVTLKGVLINDPHRNEPTVEHQ